MCLERSERNGYKDEDIETVKKDLINLPTYIDLLIDNLTEQPLTLFGYIAKMHTDEYRRDEYRNRLHLMFGLMMVSSVLFKDEIFDQFEDLLHCIANEEFAIMFSLSELCSEELGRRVINK